jgi:hypothetical protein
VRSGVSHAELGLGLALHHGQSGQASSPPRRVRVIPPDGLGASGNGMEQGEVKGGDGEEN